MKTYDELFDENGKYITDDSYTEIIKLHKMLEQANIPHTFEKFRDGYQVCYPEHYDNGNCICDAVEYFGSYSPIEIMGLLTSEEKKFDNSNEGILGNLSAEDVFERIQNHYKKGE